MRFGVDMGGTKIELLALDDEGKEIYRHRVPTPKDDYDKMVLAIRDLVLDAEKKLHKQGTVGVGIPGVISPKTGLVKNANTTVLIGKPFDKDLSQALNREIRMTNDANCFTLSEATDGAAEGHPIVFGVIIGTGCGGGLVVNGTVIDGCNAIAGEWGHNKLPDSTDEENSLRPCYCGKQGCNETYFSGTGFEHDYQLTTGEKLKATEIARAAEEGDERAIQCIERAEMRIAKALAVVINIVDPHAIVLGGGLSNIERIYPNIQKLLPKYVFSDTLETQVMKAKFGDSSGVRGAAWLWNS